MGGVKLTEDVAVGLVFGRLTVIRRWGVDKRNHTLWECVCTCGNKTTAEMTTLKSGRKKSCGCLKKQSTHSLRHGATAKGASPQLKRAWNIWVSMRDRCNNPNCNAYSNYGGRGLKVDPTWESFQTFIDDMGLPGDAGTIERVDVDKGYSKENCIWIPLEKQNANKRCTIWVTLDGIRMCLKDAAAVVGVPYIRTWKRIKVRGMTFEEAIK